MATTRSPGAPHDDRTTTEAAAQVAPLIHDVPAANGPAQVASDQASEPPHPALLCRTQVVRPAGQGVTDGAKRSGGQVTARDHADLFRGVTSLQSP